MLEQFGFPIVTADNIFDVLAELGVKPWRHAKPIVALDDYLRQDLTEKQRSDLRFAPKSQVVTVYDTADELFEGFRMEGRDWATTFVLLPGDLVPIVGEYKHGADEVVLVPPSGVPSQEDRQTDNPMMRCAKREWERETGLTLESIESLSDEPHVIWGRQSTVRYYPFIGKAREPIIGPSPPNTTQQLRTVLVPLQEWQKLIARGRGIECSGASVTYLALCRLGKIQL